MYRTVDAKFWHDVKVQKLRPDAKLLMLYLITNPHSHLSGLYYLPEVIQKHETGLPKPTLDTLWHTLSSAGFAWFDPESAVVFVKNMLTYQGKGDKAHRAAANQLQTLIDSPLVTRFVTVYPQFADTVSHRVSHGVSEFGTQEQEQNQNKEQNQNGAAAQRFVPPSVDDVRAYCLERKNQIDPEAFVSFYGSKGWMVGKNRMKDWRLAIVTWEKNSRSSNGTAKPMCIGGLDDPE